MADTPLITFIVPTYNVPQWMLRECVDSILMQPLCEGEREIIVVDDGSDTPVQAVEGVTLVRQANAGQAAARNVALEMARGKWIEFVDADDKLLAGWSRVAEALRNENELDVVRIGIDGDSRKERRLTAEQFLTNENMQGAAWRYVFRRNALRFTTGIVHEDEEFMALMLASASNMLIVGTACYYYRVREGSTMTTRTAAHIERRFNDFESVILRLRDSGLPVLRRRVAQLTMDYVYNSLRLERSLAATRRRVRQLRRQGLWPLPAVRATFKYKVFRLLAPLFLG